MSFNALPHELVEIIIDNIAASPENYRDYSLVSRRWVRRCRHHGFRTITLSSVNVYELPQSIAESISPFVLELFVDMSPHDTEEYEDTESCKNTALLTNLERVTIKGVRYTDKVLQLYQSLLAATRGNAPKVTISGNGPIECSDFRKCIAPLLCEASELHLIASFDPIRDHGPDLWSTPPQAKHLTLTTLEPSTLEIFGNMFLVAGPIRLHSLIINGWCSQWQEVVRNLGPSLEHLVILTPNHELTESNTPLDFSVDLSGSSGLKTLGYELFPYFWQAALAVDMSFSLPGDPAVKFLMHSYGSAELGWNSYKATIEQIALVCPRASFQVYNNDFGSLPGETARIPDPRTFIQRYFPKLVKNGRLTVMTKGLRSYTYSDLE